MSISSNTRASWPPSSLLRLTGYNVLLEHLTEGHYILVGAYLFEGLYFAELVDIVQGGEGLFHALDSHPLVGFDIDGFQDLREGAFSLLSDEAVLYFSLSLRSMIVKYNMADSRFTINGEHIDFEDCDGNKIKSDWLENELEELHDMLPREHEPVTKFKMNPNLEEKMDARLLKMNNQLEK